MTTDALPGLRGLLLGNRRVDDAHDVGLLHDQELLAVDLDLGARPFAEQHAIAFFDIDRNELAGLIAAARAHGDHLALGRLLLSGVRNDDAAGRLLLGLDAPDDDAVVKRTKLHGLSLALLRFACFSDGLPAALLARRGVDFLARPYLEGRWACQDTNAVR